MNRWIARGVVALAAVAAMIVAGAPGPALAEKPQFRPMACFSGAIQLALVTGEPDASAFLTLRGHLNCAAHRKPANFGFARYDADTEWGVLRLKNLQTYARTPPTPFSKGKYIEDGPVDFVICVVTDFDVKIGCVQVVREDWASRPVATLLPAKDAVYGKPFDTFEGDHRPPCGACW